MAVARLSFVSACSSCFETYLDVESKRRRLVDDCPLCCPSGSDTPVFAGRNAISRRSPKPQREVRRLGPPLGCAVRNRCAGVASSLRPFRVDSNVRPARLRSPHARGDPLSAGLGAQARARRGCRARAGSDAAVQLRFVRAEKSANLHKPDRKSDEDRRTPAPLDRAARAGARSAQRASVRAQRERADGAVPGGRAAVRDRSRQRGARPSRGAGRARRSRPRARVPVEPAGDRVAPARAGARADRRLPRGGAVARGAVRRVGGDRAGPRRSRRRRSRARARMRGPVAPRRRARERRGDRQPASGARAPGGARRAAARASGTAPGHPRAARRGGDLARRPAVVAGAHRVRRRHAGGVAGVPGRGARAPPAAARDLLDARRTRAAARRAAVLARRPLPAAAGPAGVLRDLLLRARRPCSVLEQARRPRSSCCTDPIGRSSSPASLACPTGSRGSRSSSAPAARSAPRAWRWRDERHLAALRRNAAASRATGDRSARARPAFRAPAGATSPVPSCRRS